MQVASAEAAVPVLGEGGMVGHPVDQIEPAEPTIGEVEVHLLAQASFRADAEQIADQQHPEH